MPQTPSRRPLLVLAALFVPYFLLGLRGYGNDNDTYQMIDTWLTLIHKGHYLPSRNAGYLTAELGIGLASSIGGYVLSNAVAALLATVCLLLVYSFVEPWGGRKTALFAVAAVALNPWWIIAASTSIDYLYSLGFFAVGLACLTRRRLALAALLFAAAVSARITFCVAVFIAYATCLAVFRHDRRFARALVVSFAAATGLSALLYLPAFAALGFSLKKFLEISNDSAVFSVASNAGNFVVHQMQFWGLPAVVVIAAAAIFYGRPSRWVPSTLPVETRFVLVTSVLVFAWFELFFFRLPLEPSYLLPALLAVVLPLAAIRTTGSGRLARWALPMLASFGLIQGAIIITPIQVLGTLDEPRPDLLFGPLTFARLVRLPARTASAAYIGLFAEQGVLIEDATMRDISQRPWEAWLNGGPSPMASWGPLMSR